MIGATAERATGEAIWTKLWPWCAAASSGVLLTLCFPRFNQEWLSWIALTPLLCAVWFSRSPARGKWRRDALLGYVAGIVFFTGTFRWLGSLGTLFGSLWLHGLPLLLSLYLGLYFAFWSWFVGWIRHGNFLNSRRNLGTAFLGASAWVTHEWVRGWLFSGFGWDGLGIALHADLPMIQIAEFTGVGGLSFLVAFANLMAVIIVRRLLAEIGPAFLKRVRWEFSISVLLLVLVFSFGVKKMLTHREVASTALRVAALQPNVPQVEKFASRAEEDAQQETQIFQKLDVLTMLAAASEPQLLIWPEAATPSGMFADETNYNFVQHEAQRGNFSLLIGTLDSDIDRGEDYNVAALLTNRGSNLQTYRKIHLVPFGEYMPLRHSFPLFAMIAGQLVPADFAPGREFTVLHLPTSPVNFAALICFEDTVGDLTRRFVANGADLLVNITNDGWFLQSAGSEQHLANAVFRAIENRRPLVRCTNTGVTCSVDPFGRVDVWLAPYQQGFASREIKVPAGAATTFYTRYGDLFTLVCAAVTACCIVVRAKFR